MKKATRYLAGILAFGFVLAGAIVFLRNFTGERPDSYVFPCALVGAGLLAACLAWNFGSGVDTDGACTAEGDEGGRHSSTGVESDDAA